MNLNLRAFVGSTLAVTLATMLNGAAQAADFAQTTAATRYSIQHGFGRASLPTQRRMAPSAAPLIKRSLADALCAGGCTARASQAPVTNMLERGGGRILTMSADGIAGAFDDLAVERNARFVAKDREMSGAALETAGRRFIAAKLRSVVTLGPNEELVPLHTDYLIAGGENLRTRTFARTVLANRIVFGRRVAGIPVVGGGSRIVLTFVGDGTLESLRYDWPRYREAETQTLAPVAQIVGRVGTVVGARTDAARIPENAKRITATTRANAPVGKNTATLQKLECGYFDPGVGIGSGALVQPGCVYHVVARDKDGFRQGYAGAVPGSLAFRSDAAWPESMILRTHP